MRDPLDDQLKIKLFHDSFYESLIPMFWCDESNFLMVNKVFASLTGYDTEELHNSSFDDLSSDKNTFDGIADIHKGSKSREAEVITWYLKKPGGKTKAYELRLTRLAAEETDGKTFFYGVMRQMEDRIAGTEIFSDVGSKLRDSLAASKQGVWEAYAPFKVIHMLDSFLGITENNNEFFDFDLETFISKVHKEDQPRVRIKWERFIKGDDNPYTDEYRILNSKDEYRWVDVEGKVMEVDEENKPLRVSGTVKDIDFQKNQEQTILCQTQKLIDYAFMNSHLIRGPVTSILGLVDLLGEEYDAENIERLKETTLKLDERIHEINKMIDSTKEESLFNQQVQKVSFITKDSLQSMIIKHTVESIPLKVRFDLSCDLDEYMASKPSSDSNEVVILDNESCEDIWAFLDELRSKNLSVPVYILTRHFDVELIERLNTEASVHGIILKSREHGGLFEFLKNLNQ